MITTKRAYEPARALRRCHQSDSAFDTMVYATIASVRAPHSA